MRAVADLRIELLFENAAEYKKRVPIEKAPITDFYTTAEVKEKYHVNESWIFAVAKKNNIPRTFNRGKTYWSKKHMDAYFAKKAPNPDITEWYSTQEMQEKFGMTLSAIYTFVSKNAIPKKKEGIMVYYSKKHVDITKGVATPEEPQYYTIAERWRSSISPVTNSIIMRSIIIFLRSRKANTRLFPKPNWISYLQPQRLNKLFTGACCHH